MRNDFDILHDAIVTKSFASIFTTAKSNLSKELLTLVDTNDDKKIRRLTTNLSCEKGMITSSAWNPSRIFVPAIRSRLRVPDSSSSMSRPVQMSGLRSFTKRSLSSTTKRKGSHIVNQLCGEKALRIGKIRSLPLSAFAPNMQHLSHYFNEANPMVKTNSLTITRSNLQHAVEGGLEEKSNAFDPHFVSLLSSRSLFVHGTRHRSGIMFNDSSLSSGKLTPASYIGTTRSFSSLSKVPSNRFAIPQQIVPSNAALPGIRARISFRNFSSSGKSGKNEKETLAEKNKSKDPLHSDAHAELHHNKIQEFMDSTVSTVKTNVGSAEATIKRAVEELSTGDLLSVYGIVLFIVIIAVGPSLIRRMQSSDDQYNVIDPEDPVMDLARMIRGEYLESIKRSMGNVENEDEEVAEEDDKERTGGRASAMGLDRIVADLLKSPQIQEAATTLVTKIIQSSQFKTACQLLLKELLKDLLEDPDTLKQVIHLLQNAIVDEKIKEAAVQLATEIFGDDRVLDELVVLVQRLGMEQQVKFATQALLVESAHNALNDPEILDHSMEFATDVVGDDVVQQTAGEALYNTMSYAFRPTLSVCKCGV